MENGRVNRRHVALLAGVSEATVSYVLNGTKNVTPQVRERVLDAVKQLHYTPNLVAKSLATKQTHHVALLVDNLKNPHFCELLEGVQAVASENGYIVSVIAADTSNVSSIIELVGRGVDGVINSLQMLDLKEILGVEIPTVCEGQHLRRDNFPAMNEAVQQLKASGHKHIAFLSGIPLDTPGFGRLEALKKALEQNGLPVEPKLFIENDTGYATDESAGFAMADTLLDRGVDFTAVIAINDLVAIGASRRFKEHGKEIPGDISIVGCDNLAILDYLPVGISSIDTQTFETGKVLMKALIAEIRGEKWEVPTFVCRFVNRESIEKSY